MYIAYFSKDLKCGTSKEANPQHIAEMFNLYFADIVGKLVKQNNSKMLCCQAPQRINSCNETMFICPVTENEILEVVKKVRGKFSAGTDEIPDYVVKKCIETVKMPLAHIYNASLEAGIFLERFKIAKVKPLHKKGDRKDMKNYRPISLLCVFSKILEKLMHNRLLSFLTRNTILTEA